MVVSEDIESFCEGLDNLSSNYRFVFNSLCRLKGENASKSMIMKGKEYMCNENMRVEKIKMTYDDFSSQINEICEKFVKDIEKIRSEDKYEVEELKNDFIEMKNEMEKKKEELNKKSLFREREPSFVYRGTVKSKINVDLVMKYPGSYMYREFMNGERTNNGDVFIDCESENDELIVKYMNDDESLIDDMKKMSNKKRNRLIEEMSFLELPIKKDIIREICRNEDNEMMEAWRNRRVLVNNDYSHEVNELMKTTNCFDVHFDNEYLKNIQLDKQGSSFYINLKMKYYDVIADYLKNGKRFDTKSLKKHKGESDHELIDEMKMIGIELNEEEKNTIRECFDNRFLQGSTILLDTEYDDKLREWLGNDYKWRLIYRASEHDYTAKSFHEYCDNKGPTLVVIKSIGGWIFGGYTTKSWKVVHHNELDCIYYDMIY